MRLFKTNPVLSVVEKMLGTYMCPTIISYWWSFGSLAAICLGVQLVTGIILAMHYTPHIDYAFLSIEHIMRDVNYGWFLRYTHANGASMFFIVVYLHIFRGIYYSSYLYPREMVWNTGVVIYILMMAAGFMGYVLPWGQMSLWGATVITNMFSAIPVVGKYVVTLLWGGFSVDNATLNRFFSLHYLIPFIIAAMASLHVVLKQIDGSSNPIGVQLNHDTLQFHPYFTFKDFFVFVLFFMFFSCFIFFYPNILGHSDNYIPGNPMVTPPHIVPEWYFLPFYAILRSIPNKLAGVIAMVAGFSILFALPFLNQSRIRSGWFRPIFKPFVWLFVAIWFILGWIGGELVETPYLELGQIFTVLYFAFFIVIIPGVSRLENYLNELEIS
uniref:Cytochrome b n=1 Tax=Imasa heleensis TaxID=2772037 RepID=A0A893DD35_9EUKA|nr:apocytochrome b [Imasa heleensis]QRR29769.1 apocytochrome b [Imasa heleensis]